MAKKRCQASTIVIFLENALEKMGINAECL